jgi:hypothetical protein
MRKFNILSKTVIIILFSLITFNSCKKEVQDNDTSSANNENKIEYYFNEMNDISDKVMSNGTTGLRLSDAEMSILNGCATITYDTSFATQSDPDTIIVDFGSGCLGNDGKNRSGILKIVKTGPYFSIGTVITIIPEVYVVNNNQINGYRKITNIGPNSLGQPVFNIEVNGTLSFVNDGGTITWTANRTKTWVEGYDTPFVFSDDVFSIIGSSSATKSDGNSWESSVISPLIFKRSCGNIVSGTMNLLPNNKPLREINFGNGECDNMITVSINGQSFTIITN